MTLVTDDIHLGAVVREFGGTVESFAEFHGTVKTMAAKKLTKPNAWCRNSSCDEGPLPKYTSQGIIYSILIAKSAKQDVVEIRAKDAETADIILALLQEAKGSQAILESLTVKDYGASHTAPYHVDEWIAQKKEGKNLWRIKIWELEDIGIQYRIIYTLDPRFSRYLILGVFDRGFNYEPTDPRTIRVLATYETIGIPGYR